MRVFFITIAVLLLLACSDSSDTAMPSPSDGGVGCTDPTNEGLLCAAPPPHLFGTCVDGACVCCVVEKDGGVATPCPVCQ